MTDSSWARYGSQSQAHYEARRADEVLREAARAACPICDEDGYRPNLIVCDHRDRAEVAQRGIQKCRKALAKGIA